MPPNALRVHTEYVLVKSVGPNSCKDVCTYRNRKNNHPCRMYWLVGLYNTGYSVRSSPIMLVTCLPEENCNNTRDVGNSPQTFEPPSNEGDDSRAGSLLSYLPHQRDALTDLSDEAHFWLNGYVNKQNCRIWSEANPQVYVETPLHPEKLTVWCALWAGGIIGPYFFKNDEGHNVTVNGDRYRAMIINFFIPELNNHDVQELWFQQDGATCHTARATIDLLKDTFGDRLISRFEPVNWPPRSYDLTPLDYFLWGYVKSLVCADKPQTRDHLEDNIRRVIADIRLQMLEKVIENWTSRLDYIRASHGSHMPDIIFKM
ncbi:putative DD41D transposase [Trichonephila clavipes]|nr:putative DD41D transposase [Trichonephila clavipes]